MNLLQSTINSFYDKIIQSTLITFLHKLKHKLLISFFCFSPLFHPSIDREMSSIKLKTQNFLSLLHDRLFNLHHLKGEKFSHNKVSISLFLVTKQLIVTTQYIIDYQ